MRVEQVKALLEQENSRLKKLVADIALDRVKSHFSH
jgi:hypothetical protein